VTLPAPPILVITDRRQCCEPLEMRAEALFRGGCRFLSLREKDLAPKARLDMLRRLDTLGRQYDAKLCVHDDLAAASACGTALHLPANGDAAEARRQLGAKALIGQSCHSRGEITAAAAADVDYVTLSPILPSASKPGYKPLAEIDLDGLSIPVLALGGITLETLPALPAGFAGAAIMGEAMTTPDPIAWFAAIRRAHSASHRA
jgi:thiamine-phosphate pyrophosphorylase